MTTQSGWRGFWGVNRWLVYGAIAALVGASAWAGAPAGRAPSGQQPAETAEAPDPFAVPDGTPEELLQYIESLRDQRPKDMQPETLKAFSRKLYGAAAEAAGKILAGKPTDQQAAEAARWRAVGLSALAGMGDEQAAKSLQAFPAELDKAGRKQLAREVRAYLLHNRLREALAAGPDELAALVAEIEKFVAAAPPGQTEAGLAIATTQSLEMTGNEKLAIETYRTFGKQLAASDNPQIANLAKKLEGAARRLDLVGKKMELKGELLDGKPLDWQQYRGKVVLVQFWASWCMPCREEIKNVKEQYALYHDRGFDVIGVNLDDQREDAEKFLKENPLPWKNLFSSAPDASGMDNPLATYYGVMGIPQLILVGADGNVVSLQPRGPRLGEELKKLLGPAEQQPGPRPQAPGQAS